MSGEAASLFTTESLDDVEDYIWVSFSYILVILFLLFGCWENWKKKNALQILNGIGTEITRNRHSTDRTYSIEKLITRKLSFFFTVFSQEPNGASLFSLSEFVSSLCNFLHIVSLLRKWTKETEVIDFDCVSSVFVIPTVWLVRNPRNLNWWKLLFLSNKHIVRDRFYVLAFISDF